MLSLWELTHCLLEPGGLCVKSMGINPLLIGGLCVKSMGINPLLTEPGGPCVKSMGINSLPTVTWWSLC